VIATQEGKVVLPLQLENASPYTGRPTSSYLNRCNRGLLAAIYKSPSHMWSDKDITQPLRFRNKSILEGDLNAKHSFWNNTVPNPSGKNICSYSMQMILKYQRHKTHPLLQCRKRHFAGYCGTVVHQTIRLSHVSVSDILDSDQFPIVFHILDLVITNELLKPREKFTYWECF
jgi:hypothetical protein